MPSALVIGCLTDVGVELVRVLVDSGHFTYIRAIDKSIPELACLSQSYKDYLKKVDFRQANLVFPEVASQVFDKPDGGEFDYVFNCLTQLRSDSPDEYYRLYMVQRSVNAAKEAAKRGVRVFVDQSSAMDYVVKPNYGACTEDDPLEARTVIGKYRMQKGKALRDIAGLNLVMARFGTIYGPTESTFVTPYLLTAYIVHRAQAAEIPIQLDPTAPKHTIHSVDAARAMLHLAQWYTANNKTGVELVNVVDCGDTRNIDFSKAYAVIYPHTFKYVGAPAVVTTAEESEATRTQLNDMAMDAWMAVVAENGIAHTPLSPYVYKDQFISYPVSVDNSKLKASGFEWKYPTFEADHLRDTIAEFTKQGVWPTAMGPLPPLPQVTEH